MCFVCSGPIPPRRGAPNRALSSSEVSQAAAPYQQYIQQARALIRAQQELRSSSLRSANRNRPNRNSNNSSNIYVDVPVRSNGLGYSGNLGRGRGAPRGGRFRR